MNIYFYWQCFSDSLTDLIVTCGGEVVDKLQVGGDRRTRLVISCTDVDDDDEDVKSIVKRARGNLLL